MGNLVDIHNLSSTSIVFLADFFPFGMSSNDTEVPPSQLGSLELNNNMPIVFFQNNETILYVSNDW